MRIACVLVPSFAVAVERRRDPRLADGALVVYDRNVVVDASAGAVGVRRDSPLRQAKALCPSAVFVEANHALYRRISDSMLDALESVTPVVECAGLGCAYVDVHGLHSHCEDEFALATSLAEAVRNATGLLACVCVSSATSGIFRPSSNGHFGPPPAP